MDAMVPAEVASSREALRTEVCELYLEHARALRAGLRRLTWGGCDVDDLLQDVFLIALKRPDAVLLAPSPKAWLFGVVVKVAAAARRKNQLRALLRLDVASVLARSPRPGAELDAQLDAATQVERVLGKLSRKKREVLVLFELEGLTGEEIACSLQCPVATVFTRLHHARRDFERLMVRHE